MKSLLLNNYSYYITSEEFQKSLGLENIVSFSFSPTFMTITVSTTITIC